MLFLIISSYTCPVKTKINAEIKKQTIKANHLFLFKKFPIFTSLPGAILTKLYINNVISNSVLYAIYQ